MRIKSLDLFKAIAAFMVVYIHYSTGVAGKSFLNEVFRIAVPFFLWFQVFSFIRKMMMK